MKKKGFTDEDILREQKEIAKHVKHVHVADNFGFSDSHLPPGFGNVPNKELIQQLEKEGFNGRVIVEAGSLISNFSSITRTL
jgi:sugar phosphate isomerase/epimerase